MPRAHRAPPAVRSAQRSAGPLKLRVGPQSDKEDPETARAACCIRRYWRSQGCAQYYRRWSAGHSCRWRRYKELESWSVFLLRLRGHARYFFYSPLVHLGSQRDGTLKHLELAHNIDQADSRLRRGYLR